MTTRSLYRKDFLGYPSHCYHTWASQSLYLRSWMMTGGKKNRNRTRQKKTLVGDLAKNYHTMAYWIRKIRDRSACNITPSAPRARRVNRRQPGLLSSQSNNQTLHRRRLTKKWSTSVNSPEHKSLQDTLKRPLFQRLWPFDSRFFGLIQIAPLRSESPSVLSCFFPSKTSACLCLL